jgi:hypothetical protein
MAPLSSTFTCDKCFAEVKDANRRGHSWWHAGLQELGHVVSRNASRLQPASPPAPEAAPVRLVRSPKV